MSNPSTTPRRLNPTILIPPEGDAAINWALLCSTRLPLCHRLRSISTDSSLCTQPYEPDPEVRRFSTARAHELLAAFIAANTDRCPPLSSGCAPTPDDRTHGLVGSVQWLWAALDLPAHFCDCYQIYKGGIRKSVNLSIHPFEAEDLQIKFYEADAVYEQEDEALDEAELHPTSGVLINEGKKEVLQASAKGASVQKPKPR